ncbi:hypothetical protein HAX54_042142 [Datura stramonium]|uniref:Uncharacterized protein n=1 Tax=Datura stramonium TaxID=4076 RepID=A0ABS8VYL0_DATST|nr:hypothetical protein [Datura stramonium]
MLVWWVAMFNLVGDTKEFDNVKMVADAKTLYEGKNGYGKGSYKGSNARGTTEGYGGHTKGNSQSVFSAANNASVKHEDPGQVASTSRELNNAFVAKGQGFTNDE